jgi:hypothetical protein
MKVVSRSLARMEMPYCIARVPSPAPGDMPAIAVGSESEGPLLLLRPPEYRPEVLAEKPGGFMSLCHLQWAGRPFLAASTCFKPVFRGADCRLAAWPLDRGSLPLPEDIGPLPYTHRLGLAVIGGKACLLASTLCAGKAFLDDWSRPGGVHLAVVPAAPGAGAAAWRFRSICDGLSKNHGMDQAVLTRGRRGLLLSAHEGLFFLGAPQETGGAWERETIATGEYSDGFAFPLDADDEPQVFSLSPFHGNILSRHRLTTRGWVRETIDDSIEFGHVLWAGMLLGRPGLLVGTRGAGKEIALYRPAGGGHLRKELIDEGAGPTQVAVIDRGKSGCTIFVAAHARGEVVSYAISE